MTPLEEAIAIAVHAHAGQVDKGGQPYILHCLRVMMAVEPGPAQVAAVLHDVVEDSPDWQLSDLKDFGGDVVDALDALTKRKGEPYEAYIQRVAANALARHVKLADLRDNRRLERIPFYTQEDLTRHAKYGDAIRALETYRAA